jgi:1-acyl-sn-glycerol-3-phosphate acyltransferase
MTTTLTTTASNAPRTTNATTNATTHATTNATTKRPWVLSLARRYARRTVRQRFDGLYVEGLAEAARVVGDRPVLFCANHVCWWDTFALVLVDEALGADGHALMDQENLARLPFFGALGALPLDVDGGAQARRRVDDAVRVLDRAGRALWIFPQGRQRAAHLRPLGFKPGLRLIATRAARGGAVIVPVALAYPWREAAAPSIAVRFGDAIDPSATPREELVAVVEARVARMLDDMDALLDGPRDDRRTPPAPGQLLVAPRRTSSDDGLGARLLRRFFGSRP